MDSTDEKLKQQLLEGKPGPYKFSGLLELDNSSIALLPSGVSCYELRARNSKLISLPEDINVTSRITLDHSTDLQTLPAGLKTGSLSLERCTSIEALPEGLDVWFLNLDGCSRFRQWPNAGSIQRGSLSMRNCLDVQSLPAWLSTLANLNVSGCPLISEVPAGITINGWIDVGGSGITSLPDGMDGVSVHWRSVPVSREIAFEPDSITSKQILAAPNAEIRRVMIERMGYLAFAKQANAKTLDQDTDKGGARQLLKIELSEDEPLVGLSCLCPSTGRQFFLRVPPDTTSCHEAAAWIAGYDSPSKYNPIIET